MRRWARFTSGSHLSAHIASSCRSTISAWRGVRRYSAFVDDFMQPLIPVHKFITIAALVTGAAQFIFLYNLIYSRFKGAPAPQNPWEATSLEWTIPSPPPFDNFGGKLPVVYHDPYQYGVESSTGDYVMQDSPEQIRSVRDEA